MPQVKGARVPGTFPIRPSLNLTIRMDHSGAKLENKRLKNTMRDTLDELQRRKYRRNADKTFDIKAAQKDAKLVLSQAKMIKSTEGLWEDTVLRGRRRRKPASASAFSFHSSSALSSFTDMANSSAIKGNSKEKKRRPQSSVTFASDTSFVNPTDGGGGSGTKHTPGTLSDLSDGEISFVESDREHPEDTDATDEDFVNPYRTWAQPRQRPLSAFLPSDQIPHGSSFESSSKPSRRIKSAQPEARTYPSRDPRRHAATQPESAISESEDDRGVDSDIPSLPSASSKRRGKRRPLTAAADGKDKHRVRSFQHLKELVHIDSLSRARYVEARNQLMRVRNEQRLREEQLLSLKIQKFYANVDDFVKHTKESLRGPQVVENSFAMKLHLDLSKLTM